MKIVAKLFIFSIKIYQGLISPWFPSSCRHQPTCSSYTIQAIKIWGPFRGIWLGIKRLSKCHPMGTSGYDPVPEKEKKSAV
ncbi:MAG: membrane protein insertion efficiency factor YidD [Flavobacteriales bacterium]|nr:membrane protein insertion efficiency factor YidD [Flavobacteriales bacterium]|tara:strand:- start:1319 stop:1561 length:243 start_codon:yes stop_codon:yes gene_type:complete